MVGLSAFVSPGVSSEGYTLAAGSVIRASGPSSFLTFSLSSFDEFLGAFPSFGMKTE